jgi:DNA processing protein
MVKLNTMEQSYSTKSRYFPVELASIPGAPQALYLQGDKSVMLRRKIAIVGSRRASQRGRRMAADLTQIAVNHNWVTVSGLARGIDSVVHQKTVEVGGQTIAVLAHGLDRVYPPENRDLAQQILDQGGLLVSEHPGGTPPRKDLFLARNRIVVGLSWLLIIVEAGLRSGSLSSATHAAEQGREVLVVSGSPGCDLLIREGAASIENPAEFQAFLERLA